jgi:rod shape-determining protein MreD
MDKMMTKPVSGLVVPLTFFVALVLMLLPMPGWAFSLRPIWILMVIIFWIQARPQRAGMAVAWLAGFLQDVLNGTLLGEHALAMTIAAFVMISLRHRFYMFPQMQQGFVVLLLVLMYQAVLYCVQGFLGELPASGLYWLGALTSMLLWPWVFSILKTVQAYAGHAL